MLSANPASHENVLVGLVALQSDLISRAALVANVRKWCEDRSTVLGKILVDKGALKASDLSSVEILVARLLDSQNGDIEKSLGTVPCLREVSVALKGVADDELRACLERVCASAPDAEPAASLPDAQGPTATPTATRAPTAKTPKAGALAANPNAPQRFRVVRQINEGQMGKLLLAHDEELDREVVIKEIHAQHAGDEDIMARFDREVKYASLLQHSGIVPIYGAGRHADGRRYYAMRYIKGETLKAAIAHCHDTSTAAEWQQRLRALVARYVTVCRAIAFAHDRGVIHRDIKPENIMLSEDGETLVVDWGLAKPFATEGTSIGSGPEQANLTSMSQFVGTPAYASPEQAACEPDLKPASDVYSLGATLYCMLTGRAPFVKAASHSEPVLSMVARADFPSPRQARPDVPRALEAICLKAMKLQPGDRYTSARALADELERWCVNAPATEASTGFLSQSLQRHPVLAVTTLSLWLALIMALALHLVWPPSSDSPPESADWKAKYDASARELQMAWKGLQEAKDLAALGGDATELKTALATATKELTDAKATLQTAEAERKLAVNRAGAAEAEARESAATAKKAFAAEQEKNESLKKEIAEAEMRHKLELAKVPGNLSPKLKEMQRQLDLARKANEHTYEDALRSLDGLKAYLADEMGRRHLATMYQKLGDKQFGVDEFVNARKAYNMAKTLQEELLSRASPAVKEKIAKELALTRNNLAWLLATSADVAMRDPKQAVDLATKAAEADPSGEYYSTLGIALYRLGALFASDKPEAASHQWQTAIQALEKARSWKDADNESRITAELFLAMTHWKIHVPKAAQKWYESAISGLEGTVESTEIRRFREEAEQVKKQAKTP